MQSIGLPIYKRPFSMISHRKEIDTAPLRFLVLLGSNSFAHVVAMLPNIANPNHRLPQKELGQHRIILRADTASEVRQMRFKKRR